MATMIVDIDLANGPRPVSVPTAYRSALLLLRWRGRPLGQLRWEPVEDCRIAAADLWLAASRALGERLAAAALDELLDWPAEGPSVGTPLPSCSVVVCTRDRTDDLRRCLDSICSASSGLGAEVIVVDNAPRHDGTARLVEGYPVRYVREPRPGLNWARGRGARVASGEVVIYMDDDVVVDRGWIDAMRRPFADPRVAGVTGLVMPAELETEAQEQFERFVGFGRGFEYREFSAGNTDPVQAAPVGAGASMAFRRKLILGLGLFDVELDCGTPALSGGDQYAFYRLLSLGHVLVYNPHALSWHRHRRHLDELRSQLHDYSVGVCCWLLRSLLVHGEGTALSACFGWFLGHHLCQIWLGLRRHEDAQPLSLTLAEVRGVLAAPFALLASLLRERPAAWPSVGTPSR
jgi:GT2 family glycosyltransferase